MNAIARVMMTVTKSRMIIIAHVTWKCATICGWIVTMPVTMVASTTGTSVKIVARLRAQETITSVADGILSFTNSDVALLLVSENFSRQCAPQLDDSTRLKLRPDVRFYMDLHSALSSSIQICLDCRLPVLDLPCHEQQKK